MMNRQELASMSEMLLSAMLDGECSASEAQRVLDAARASPPLRRHWSRLCLVREALHGVRVRAFDEDFCAGVMAALERGETQSSAAGKVIAPTRRHRSFWRPLVGLAAAASLAAITGVGLHAWLQPAPQPIATAQAGAPAPRQVVQQLAALPAQAADSTPAPVETRWSQLDADTARQLNEFLLEHSNLRAAQGMGGALSYARITARPVDYRQDSSH
jgi:negative regulator of sigma E activity